ncbi:GNAT family N-acetyltransferase [Kitasatospora sp. NPDC006697]|uniref:GNAT family N-acetyltransferase n=1 Tax=Kitasatospora sp. NPDC006697 TaxID=3364020 RepID=UPI00367B68F8
MVDAVGPFAEYQPAPADRPAPVAITLAEAVAGDLPELAALKVAERGGTAGYWAERLARRVPAGPDELVVVARSGGELVGYAGVTLLTEHPGDGAPAGWYLSGVTVAPDWRRRGIGGALTDWRLARMRELAVPEVWCFVSARNPASLDLHRALGFTEHGRGRSFQGITFGGGEGVLLVLRLG